MRASGQIIPVTTHVETKKALMVRGMIMRNQVDNPFSFKPFNSQDLGDILFLGFKKKEKEIGVTKVTLPCLLDTFFKLPGGVTIMVL